MPSLKCNDTESTAITFEDYQLIEGYFQDTSPIDMTYILVLEGVPSSSSSQIDREQARIRLHTL
jgi:hypothetical protein